MMPITRTLSDLSRRFWGGGSDQERQILDDAFEAGVTMADVIDATVNGGGGGGDGLTEEEISDLVGTMFSSNTETGITATYQDADNTIDLVVTDAPLLGGQDSAYHLARAHHSGTQSADSLTDGTTNKAFLATERTKLAGVATAATANSADATLLARANHTGSQAASTISDFSEAVDDRVAALLVEGDGIDFTYDDTANTLTIDVLPGGGDGAADASELPFTPTGTIASSDTQAAIEEVAADATTALGAHATDSTGVHGITDTATLLSATIADAKGDIIAASAADTVARVPVGSNGQVLTADSTQTLGLKWAPASSGSTATDSIWDAAGDLAVGSGSDTATKLSKGSALQSLRVNAAGTALEWSAPQSRMIAHSESDAGPSASSSKTAILSFSLAQGSVAAGDRIHVRASGTYFNNSGGSTNTTHNLEIGGSGAFSAVASVSLPAHATSTGHWTIDAWITVAATNSLKVSANLSATSTGATDNFLAALNAGQSLVGSGGSSAADTSAGAVTVAWVTTVASATSTAFTCNGFTAVQHRAA